MSHPPERLHHEKMRISALVDDGRPFTADYAIMMAIEMDDSLDRLEFLKAWCHGEWDICLQMLEEDA